MMMRKNTATVSSDDHAVERIQVDGNGCKNGEHATFLH